jgi:hypothetical protein
MRGGSRPERTMQHRAFGQRVAERTMQHRAFGQRVGKVQRFMQGPGSWPGGQWPGSWQWSLSQGPRP